MVEEERWNFRRFQVVYRDGVWYVETKEEIPYDEVVRIVEYLKHDLEEV